MTTKKPIRPLRWTPEQREAVAVAREDGRTAPEVARLAASGKLHHNGERLPAFEMPAATIRDVSVRWRRRRARAGMAGELRELQHKDAIEILRAELVDLVQREIRRLKRQQRAHGSVDAAELQRTVRALIDLARVPAPTDPAPVGVNVLDERTGLRGVASRGGPAGSLLKAHRNGPPGLLPAQASTPLTGARAPDFEPATPVDDEQPPPDPGREVAEALRADIQAAARSHSDADDRYDS